MIRSPRKQLQPMSDPVRPDDCLQDISLKLFSFPQVLFIDQHERNQRFRTKWEMKLIDSSG